jgi:hypothetical protein
VEFGVFEIGDVVAKEVTGGYYIVQSYILSF